MAAEYDEMSLEDLMTLYESQVSGALPATAQEQMPQVQATEGDQGATSADISNQRIQATRNVLANKVNKFSPEQSEV